MTHSAGDWSPAPTAKGPLQRGLRDLALDDLVAGEVAVHVFASAEIRLESAGLPVGIDHKGPGPAGAGAFVRADLEPEVGGAIVEDAAHRIVPGPRVPAVDLDVEGEVLPVQRSGQQDVQLRRAREIPALGAGGGEHPRG